VNPRWPAPKEQRDLADGQRIIRNLTKLLGRPVVLIPVHRKSKRPRLKRFQTFTLDLMQYGQYVGCIGRQGCNVAVLLGEPSGGICTLDFDDDQNAECFLDYNPRYRDTLATTAKRGCNLWFWISGEYPASFDLVSPDKPSWDAKGELERPPNIVEFRANGRITILCGTHPCGYPYRLLNRALPITVRWSDIVWPEAWQSRVEAATRPPQPQKPRRVRDLRVAAGFRNGRSIDAANLENLKEQRGGAFRNARCPACAAMGGDRSGNHLIVFPTGAFGCVLYPGHSPEARNHRRIILEIAGS
jgi:hypothetical protein